MKSYGWMNKRAIRAYHDWMGNGLGGSLGEEVYEYGWPSGGSSESNVTFQLLFDEASSPLVDEVASVNVPEVIASPTYQVDTSAYSSEMAVGATTTSSSAWQKTTTTSEVAPGTNDWVFECVWKSAASNNGEIIDTRDSAAVAVGGWYMSVSSGTSGVTFQVIADDGTSVFTGATVPDLFDGNFHKIRVVYDRSGNLEFFVDGSSKRTASMAALVGKNVPAHGIAVGVRATGAFRAVGTYTEMRVSIGTTSNNSGGPGGG